MDWIALLAAAASIISVLYNYFKLREDRARVRAEAEKVKADAEKLAAEALKIHSETAAFAKQSDLDRAIKIIDQLQEDNERLRNRLREFEDKSEEREKELLALRSESADLRFGVLVLIGQLEEMGVKPKWIPEKV